ncbi:autotransporter-associated beta strand repeat-containing protein [Deltaproteobacteria bacterium OttesenSCG-928-M10]|nr:autotransporter-associated beta strand repeat-containing protein [Deltaproteobacteria bacterium OttesenSCG-928-M10]
MSKIKTGVTVGREEFHSAEYYYYNFNEYEKDGDSTWTLTGTATADTGWTVKRGKLAVFSDANLGSGPAALTLAGGTLLATDTFSTNRNIALTGLTGNGLEVAAGKNLTANGVVSGSRGFVKSGPGTLTLAGNNTFTGSADLSAGTLALSGAGNISTASGLVMAGGTVFDIAGISAGSTAIKSLTVAGAGASITATGGKKLTLANNLVTVDISGLANKAVMLDAGGAITTDTATNVSLAGIPSLKRGQSVTILQNLDNASDFTDMTGLTYGRLLFDLSLDGFDLRLVSDGYTSFRDDSGGLFGPVGLNNSNIRNGSDYLDRLDNANDPFIDTLAEAYDRATLGRGPGEASRALQQLYGGYAAYANQALGACRGIII